MGGDLQTLRDTFRIDKLPIDRGEVVEIKVPSVPKSNLGSGSLLGFLFWNWYPARVYMGDVGSTFLGACYSGLIILSSSFSEGIV